MKVHDQPVSRLICAILLLSCVNLCAFDLDTIGVTLLRAVTTNVVGSGVRVAQVEAGYDLGTNWEVNPGNVGQRTNLFKYFGFGGSATNYPNSISSESAHAGVVALYFYGTPYGVATNVMHVDNYDASYFVQESIVVIGPVTNYSATLPSTNINDAVVNQSFIICNFDFSHFPVSWEQTANTSYDNYAAQFKTLFVSGAGNGGPGNDAYAYPPATCYNGLGVGAYGGNSCIGPTLDNGRCKPDITAPGTETSYSTPQVAGAAAVLVQAGRRGDGGPNTNAASDMRTVKALLLNGAVKPADWTNVAPAPLDFRYGAGRLNVFNAYEQLAGGQHGFIASFTPSAGGPHPPSGATGTVAAPSGWDFNSLTSLAHPAVDAVNEYFFNVTNGDANAQFTATATLVWNKQQGQSAINNLALFLYNCANSNLVACSTSLVDNVQHLFVPNLAQGRYDLQVWKAGGSGIVSAGESYALAWEFFSERLNETNSGTSVALSWPVYPAGFVVESAPSLSPPQNWSTNNIPPPAVTNFQNYLILNAVNAQQFFRLRQPDF
jgi:hypothetical protein